MVEYMEIFGEDTKYARTFSEERDKFIWYLSKTNLRGISTVKKLAIKYLRRSSIGQISKRSTI